jgi:cytidylate kinase
MPTQQPPQAVILVTGIQASGKSTIAQLLAERLPQSVHVRGDLFRRMIINGRADMTPDPASEAVRQLRLRHQPAATVSDAYFRAGFTVIVQHIVLGAHLAEMTTMIRSRPLLLTWARAGQRRAADDPIRKRSCGEGRASAPATYCLHGDDGTER